MAKSGAKLFFAAAFGLAAGIGVGMLIAPAKGSKTRKRLKKKIMRIADTFEDDFSDKLNAIKSAFSGENENEETDDLPLEETEETDHEKTN